MEALLAANEDILIPPLSLTLNKGASYILARRQATIFSAVSRASPQGVQTLKFNIASTTEWADPASVIISFDVVNESGNPLYPATVGAHCLFERYQCRISSQSIEDQEHYGRTVECLSRLIPAEKRLNEGALGFGTDMSQSVAGTAAAANPSDTPEAAGVARLVNGAVVSGNPFLGGSHVAKPILGFSRKRVYMKLPLSGVFTAHQKYLPCWSMGAGGVEVLLSLAPAADSFIPGTDKSSAYHLEDIRLEVDMVTIDSGVQEQYNDALRNGGSLQIHTKMWNTTQVYLPADNSGSFDVSLAKSLTKLATCFFNFSEELDDTAKQNGRMYANTFLMYPAAYETIESFVQVGSRRFPEFSNKGVTSHFWKLTNALGIARSLPHSVNTDVDSYASDSFAMGFDLEACPLVAASGINTTGGQEISLRVKNFRDGANIPRRCWAMLHYEAIIHLQSTGAHLMF